MMKGIQITHFAFLTTQKNHYQEIIAFAIIAFMGEMNYLFTFWKILKQTHYEIHITNYTNDRSTRWRTYLFG
jgi:hypothetical protein